VGKVDNSGRSLFSLMIRSVYDRIIGAEAVISMD
jgi:hypothetical protein